MAGQIHFGLGVLALLFGLMNLLRDKGTPSHRWVGMIYACSIYALTASTFYVKAAATYAVFYYVIAIATALTLTLALYFPLRRRRFPNWLDYHYFGVSYSYVGLLMGSGSHFFRYTSDLPPIIQTLLLWGVPLLGGTLLIFARQKRIVGRAQMRYFMRRNMHHREMTPTL